MGSSLTRDTAREEIKCETCPAFDVFFATSLINSRMLDSIYHINCIFGVKTSRFSFILRIVIKDVITFLRNL